MLVDHFPQPPDGSNLRETLVQRMRYLASRAERSEETSRPRWRRQLVQATLWMEAAEAAVALEDFEVARACLASASKLLVELKLPLGVAIRSAFRIPGGEVAEDAVMETWRRALLERTSPAEPDLDFQPDIEGAFDIPQQWAYYWLAVSGADTRRPEFTESFGPARERMHEMFSAPVGRLRLPWEDYFVVATQTMDARSRRESPYAASERLPDAEDVVGKSLAGLYRVLRQSSENAYLWERLLSPVPMFDLDTAMLIARVLEASPAPETSSRLQQQASAVSEAAAGYASDFVDAVRQLRGRAPEAIHLL